MKNWDAEAWGAAGAAGGTSAETFYMHRRPVQKHF